MTAHPVFGFFREYEFLSNYFPCVIILDGLMYPSAEHAYQAQKYLDRAECQAIGRLPTPDLAKQYARKNGAIREEWECTKIHSMLLVLRAKFFQNLELRAKLVHTGEMTLVEENWWGDRFWGVVKGEGLNHLGTLLMQVRHECAASALRCGPTDKL